VIFVPINILYRDREINQSCRPPLQGGGGATLLPGAFTWTPNTNRVGNVRIARRGAAFLDGDAPAAIVYTSGTTGASKGAASHAQQFRFERAELIACCVSTKSGPPALPLPLFHVHGLGNGLHCWLISGVARACSSASSTSGRRRVPRPSARRCFFRRADDVRRLLDIATRRRGKSRPYAPLCLRLGSAAPARLEEFRLRFGHGSSNATA